MAQPKLNTFQSYDLTKEEEISGTILSLNQKFVIQNKLADIAQQKINLVFDPKNTADYQIQVSYLQGQMDILNYILATSVETEQAVLLEAQSQSDSQST